MSVFLALIKVFFSFSFFQPIYCQTHAFDGPNADNLIEDLRRDIEARIDLFQRPDDANDNLPLLATMVRLVFHDCAGRGYVNNDLHGTCNGCIDPTNNDHNGLEYGVIYPLEQVYQNQDIITMNKYENSVTYDVDDASYTWTNPSGTTWSSILSRSDFWAIAGTMAVEYGIELAYIDSLTGKGKGKGKGASIERPQTWNEALGNGQNVRYYFGRNNQGCDGNTAWNNDPDVSRFSADAKWGHEKLFSFFKEKFDFTPIQSVAIMGAHTLGRAHGLVNQVAPSQLNANECCGGSGFRGSWVRRNTFFVDNGFYTRLFDTQWQQVAPCNNGNDGCDSSFLSESDALSWRVQRRRTFAQLMLNVDMALAYNIQGFIDQQTQNGKVNCKHPLFQGSNLPSCERLEGNNDEIKDEIDAYASDNLDWLQNFWEAWEIMITTGYDNLNYVESNA